MQIGKYQLQNNLVLAPMAGVTDLPFRQLCVAFGADMAVSEMVSSNSVLQNNPKTRRRICHIGECEPRAVQIMGNDPKMMADAARFNVDHGAQIIDINMGCPAKKVCNIAAGSALMKDVPQIQRILTAIIKAVDVPVTLKMRTGWDKQHRNAADIARLAENEGVAALTIHGRTKACGFSGTAEYDTIANVKSLVSIPVIANGDIRTPEMAKAVIQYTNADAIMVGRAAQGNPWIFRDIAAYLVHGEKLEAVSSHEMGIILQQHLQRIYDFYGEYLGIRIARKHIAWYSKGFADGARFRDKINKVQSAAEQIASVQIFFQRLEAQHRNIL